MFIDCLYIFLKEIYFPAFIGIFSLALLRWQSSIQILKRIFSLHVYQLMTTAISSAAG